MIIFWYLPLKTPISHRNSGTVGETAQYTINDPSVVGFKPSNLTITPVLNIDDTMMATNDPGPRAIAWYQIAK